MTIRDQRVARLLPIVHYAIERKVASRGADYWDHASLRELAICEQDERDTDSQLGRAQDEIDRTRRGWLRRSSRTSRDCAVGGLSEASCSSGRTTPRSSFAAKPEWPNVRSWESAPASSHRRYRLLIHSV